MSTRDTLEPERINTSETTSPHRTDIQLVADHLARNGIKVINAEPESHPHLEITISKDKVESTQALLKDAETDQQYRIITPEETNTLRKWPISNTESDQPRTVFIVPQRGTRFTPERKSTLRSSHL